ncbi:hypothetical protein P170DRAFT_185319 [Aspergillus steynii IBT 23096]|uniref:Uncharacterized protein n=1 Tax=Aspergillus steynii IBT 23096 TaxID=1392250 RepID=A0A2I2G9I0_9EURO|nr:uncharacterized protein P170DRAFT_185319 [Aspergillus steynii IBT 23096]PLB49503.1 hypothetical protein P170DRAFT_185319 [Aspergillus steynii IBT 23096]
MRVRTRSTALDGVRRTLLHIPIIFITLLIISGSCPPDGLHEDVGRICDRSQRWSSRPRGMAEMNQRSFHSGDVAEGNRVGQRFQTISLVFPPFTQPNYWAEIRVTTRGDPRSGSPQGCQLSRSGVCHSLRTHELPSLLNPWNGN